MFFILGLGNPGEEYEWSRHNLGFMLIDKLARDAAIDLRRRECQALVGRGVMKGTEVLLVKPQTFSLHAHCIKGGQRIHIRK